MGAGAAATFSVGRETDATETPAEGDALRLRTATDAGRRPATASTPSGGPVAASLMTDADTGW